MKQIIIFLLCLGFFVTFQNNTDKKMYYWLWWVSHPYDHVLPVNMAGGEIEAGESHILISEYKSGIYGVEWETATKDFTTMQFITTDKNKKVTLTPQEVFIE